MGKVIERVREREVQRERRLIAQAQFELLQLVIDASPANVLLELLDRWKKRLRRGG